jgi:hypothetical protein
MILASETRLSFPLMPLPLMQSRFIRTLRLEPLAPEESLGGGMLFITVQEVGKVLKSWLLALVVEYH